MIQPVYPKNLVLIERQEVTEMGFDVADDSTEFEQLLLCGSIGAVAGAIAFASLGAFIGVTISTRPGTRSRTSSR